MTDIAYKGLSAAEDIFKSVVWDSLITAALNALFAYCPYLAIPVVKPVLTFALTKFTNFLFDRLRLITDLSAIVLVNEAHKAAFSSAQIRLKVIAHDRGLDSPEFLTAREEAKRELAKFVSFGGR